MRGQDRTPGFDTPGSASWDGRGGDLYCRGQRYRSPNCTRRLYCWCI